jgi:hypothetical protein
LKNVLGCDLFGDKLIKSHSTSLYYNQWRKRPAYSIKFNIDEEYFIANKSDIDSKKDNPKKYKELFDTMEDDFYKYRKIIEKEVNKINFANLNLEVEFYDNTFHKNYFELTLLLITKIVKL